MVKIDNYASAGYALELLAQSPYHRQFPLGDYFRAEILPALWAGQLRFYLTEQDVPMTFVTWAWVSKEVEAELHETGRALNRDEWCCGDRMFLNDWVSPYGGVRHYVRDLMDNVFPDVNYASSLRRNPDRSVRRVNLWKRRSPAQEIQQAAS